MGNETTDNSYNKILLSWTVLLKNDQGFISLHCERTNFAYAIYLPFPQQVLVFTCLQYKAFENTAGKKKKLLVTSNFSFSHSIFYLLGELFAFSSKSKMSSANSFKLEGSKVCGLERGFNQALVLNTSFATLDKLE